MRDLKNESTQVIFLPAKNYGGTATTDGTAVDLKGEGRKFLSILTCGQTDETATLAIKFEQSHDNSAWADLHVFDEVATDKVAVVVDLTPARRYVRAKVTRASAGTTVVSLTGVVYSERYVPSNVS
jgi:hypothetical protein